MTLMSRGGKRGCLNRIIIGRICLIRIGRRTSRGLLLLQVGMVNNIFFLGIANEPPPPQFDFFKHFMTHVIQTKLLASKYLIFD